VCVSSQSFFLTGDHKIVICFEHVDDRGRGVLSDWDLEKRQRRAINAWLINARKYDREMAQGTLIFKLEIPDLYYAKFRTSNVELRPRLFLGPDRYPNGLTFLERVIKRDGRELPDRRSSRAPERLREAQADPGTRVREVSLKAGSTSWRKRRRVRKGNGKTGWKVWVGSESF